MSSGNVVAAVGGESDPHERDTVDSVATCAARPGAGSGRDVPTHSSWTIDGQDPADWLMDAVGRQAWRTGEEPPSPAQVAMVLHGLAQHAPLEQAREWDRLRHGREDHLWPTTLSIGRWLHALGDRIEIDVLLLREQEEAAPPRGPGTVHPLVARQSEQCERCDGRVVLVRLDGGQRVPVDVDPDPDGRIAVRVNGIGAVRGRVLTSERPVVEDTERLHLIHFATCGREPDSPDAARKSDGVVPGYVARAAAHRADRDSGGLWEQDVLPTGPVPTVPAASAARAPAPRGRTRP